MTAWRRPFQFLAQHELWLAVLLVGMSILWTDTLIWALLGLGILSLVRWVGQGRWSTRTPVDWLILMLTGMALVSLAITPLPENTQPQVIRLLTGLVLFYSIVNWLTSYARVAWLSACVAAIAPALAVLAVFSVEWPAGKLPLIPRSLYDSFARVVSDAVHPNVLAGNLAVVLPICLALFLFRWGETSLKTWQRFLLRGLIALALAFSVGILFLTQSRGSWMAFGLAAAVLLMLRFRLGWLLVLLSGAGGAAAAYYFLDVPRLLRWVRSSFLVGELSNRIELWARGIFMLEDFFFTGIGMGNYAQTADALYPLRGAAPPHVHNLFLQVGIDLGMPGLLVWLAVFLIVTWAAWRLARWDTPFLWVRALGAGLLGSQLALALHGLFDAVTWGMIRPAPLIWGMWGLCLGAYLLANRSVQVEPEAV